MCTDGRPGDHDTRIFHDTGWLAQHTMANRFGEVFAPNAVGTAVAL